jgi:decaprenylphospho-beta-D-erythro-pentofuranosid-2-ulose 2-reductase
MPTVLLLGATSDMGFAIAKKFASEKFDVQLAARRTDILAPQKSDIEIRYGVNCSLHAFDALDFNSHKRFYASLEKKPDVVIYVIGYMNDNEKTVADWEETLRTINTNYTGAVSILNIVAEDFAKKGAGTIIGVSSVAGERGRQSNYMYGSAKSAFTAYLSGLRNKMYHHGVHVMTVLPGFVYTKMTEHLKLPAVLTAKPEEVGDAVYSGFKKKKDILFVKWFWKYIMMAITSIPETMFKKKKL